MPKGSCLFFTTSFFSLVDSIVQLLIILCTVMMPGMPFHYLFLISVLLFVQEHRFFTGSSLVVRFLNVTVVVFALVYIPCGMMY